MNTFKIGERMIGGNSPVYLIAEAGVNHNGDLNLAKKLIDAAAESGADAVKFQSYVVSELILPEVEKADYQKAADKDSANQTEMLERLRIDEAFHHALIARCREKKITFLSTPYDIPSLELLLSLDVPAVKIASTDTTNLLFLEQAGRSKKPVILSTGMSSLQEIRQAIGCLRDNGCADLAVLKCTSSYPTQLPDVNLKEITTFRSYFDAVIGFSDHTPGVGASPYAAALGAKIVEKHFTLDKSLPGPDHPASLDPLELNAWVRAIRDVELMLGHSEIEPAPVELINKKSLQKNLVARTDIPSGTVLSRSNLAAKRTNGRGIPASAFYEALGKRVRIPIPTNQPLEWTDLS